MTAVTRWGLAVAVVWAGTVSGSGQVPPPRPDPGTPATVAPAALTPCETAEADVLVLRARVMQLEQQLVSAQLESERVRLEAKFREKLKPPADHVFDWSSKQFRPPAVPGSQP